MKKFLFLSPISIREGDWNASLMWMGDRWLLRGVTRRNKVSQVTRRRSVLEEVDRCAIQELLANIVGRKAAVQLLEKHGSLLSIAQMEQSQLQEYGGVGEARAGRLKSAFALAAHLARERHGSRPLLDAPEKVADLMRDEMRLYEAEHFKVLLVDARRRLMAIESVALGTVDSVLIHPREVFCRAVRSRAASIILCHNHPSGDATPSEADIKVTRDLVRAGAIMKIDIVDHVIIGKPMESELRDFVSLRELGYWAGY